MKNDTHFTFKKNIFLLFVLLLISSMSLKAQLLTEQFNYTAHATNGIYTQSSGAWGNINTGDSILIDAGSLSYSGLPASVGNKVKFDGAGTDNSRTFTSQNSGTVYYSFILNVTSLGSITTTGDYFTGLAANNTTFGTTCWTRSNGSNFDIGVNLRTTVAQTVWSSSSYAINTNILVVLGYTFLAGTTNDTAKIWINPSASTFGSATAPAPTFTMANTGSTDQTALDRIFLRQNNTSGTPFVTMDEARVATSWALAVPSGASIVTTGTLSDFGSVAVNGHSSEQTFSDSGSSLSADITVTAPSQFEVSLTSGSGFGSTVTLTQSGGVVHPTTIYVRYSPTSGGAASGNVTSATTGATTTNVAVTGTGIDAPTLTTPTSASITTTTATLGGTISSSNGSTVTASGVAYSTSSNPTTPTVGTSPLVTSGAFTVDVTSLSSNTLYHYRGYATNSVGTAYTTDATFTTLPAAVVATSATSVTTASFSANWNAVSGSASVTYRLDVATDNGFSSMVSGYNDLNVGNVTTYSVTGLSFSTPYYYRVRAVNVQGAGASSNTITLTTSAPANSTSSDIIATSGYTYSTGIDYASFQEATDLTTGNSQSVFGITIRDGGATSPDGDALGTILTAITFNTTNSGYLRRVALYNGATELGEVAVSGATITFSGLNATAADNSTLDLVLRASFTTSVVDQGRISFTVTSATANNSGSLFTATDAGAAASSTTGNDNKINVIATKLDFTTQPSTSAVSGSNLTQEPVVTARDANNNTDLDFGGTVTLTNSGSLSMSGNAVAAISGVVTYSSFKFTSSGTGVTLSTTNTASLANSTSGSVNVFDAEPTSQASGVSFANVTTSGFTINWGAGNGANSIIVVKSGSAVNSDPVDGISYTANAAFGSGTQIGTGNYVVYSGNGTTVNVTGLSSGVVYYVAAYTYNGAAGTENYLGSAATANQQTNAQTYTWNLTTSGSFATAANWTPSRTSPGTTDVLVFSNGGNDTVTGLTTQTVGQVSISGNTTVHFQASPTATLSIGGGTGVDLSVAAGSTWYVDGGTVVLVNLLTGTTGTISGTVILQGAAHKLQAVDASAVTFTSTGVFSTGPSFSSNPFGAGTGASGLSSIVFQSGSSFIFTTGSNPFASAAPTSVCIFQTGSTFYHKGSGIPSISGRTYANFELMSGFTITGNFSRTTQFDNITIDSGSSFTAWATVDTAGLIIRGNLTTNKTGNLTIRNGLTNPLLLNNTTQTLGSTGGTGTLKFSGPVTVSSGTTVTLLQNVTTDSTGTFTVNGTLNTSTFALGGNRPVTVASGGVLKLGSTSGTGALAANVSSSGTLTLSSGSTVEFNGSAAQFAAAGTYSNLTINNANGVSLVGDVTVNGTLSLSSNKITATNNSVYVTSTGSVSRTSGYVVGNLKKQYASTGSQTFEVGGPVAYSPVTVNATAGTGDFTVKATEGTYPTPFSSHELGRWWTLTSSGITTADVTFNYNAGDVVGTESNYSIKKYTAGAWSAPGGSVDAVNHNASITGVSSFAGDWTLAECATITLTASLPNVTIHNAYNNSVTASGGQGTYLYSYTGTVPTGLILGTNGVFTGTPSATGTFNFTVTATDANGCTGQQGYSVTVNCPTITMTPSILNAQNNIAYSQNISASGGTTPYLYGVTSGSLPPGFNLSVTNNIATIAGTSTSNGTYNFDVTVTDADSCKKTQSYSISVTSCPNIFLSGPLPHASLNDAYVDTIFGSGGQNPYTFSVTGGSLPNGLTLGSNGVFAGAPTVIGKYDFTVTATDNNGCPGSRSYSLVVCGPISVNPPTLPNGTANASYDQTFIASGSNAPYTFTKTGNLPTGITLALNGHLSGTPTQTGDFNFTLTATDTFGCSADVNYALHINCPTITVSQTLINGNIGVNYNHSVTANGGVGTYNYTLASGSVPTGLTLASNGVLSGRPTANGTFNFTITATDANNCSGQQGYSVVISCPTITTGPASLPNANLNVTYSQNITGNGGTVPYSFLITSGTLPSGLTLGTDGVFSGAPTASGNFPFTVQATDSFGCQGTHNYSLFVIGSAATAINNGNWSNGATWDQGAKPTVDQDVIIAANVTLDEVFDSVKSVIVNSGKILDLGVNHLGVSVLFKANSGSEVKQGIALTAVFPATLIDVPGLSAQIVLDPTSTYTVTGGPVQGINDTVTFGNLNYTSTGNATPPPGTIIMGNLVKDGVGEIRGGTSTVSRMLIVHGNVTVNGGVLYGSNSTSPATGGWDIDGNLTLNAGTTLAGARFSGLGTFNVGGNLINNGGTISVGVGTGNYMIYFKGANASNFDPGTTNAVKSVTIPAGKTVNLGGHNLSTTATYSVIDSGTLNFGNVNIVGAGNFALAQDGAIGISSVDGVTLSGATGNIQVSGTRSYSKGGNYAYTGTALQNTGNGLQDTVHNLTINNVNNVNLNGGSVTTMGTLTVTNGQLLTGSNLVTLGAPTGNLVESAGKLVVGKVISTRDVTSPENFGAIGFDIDPAGGPLPGVTMVTRVTGTALGNTNQSIQRYYDVNATVNANLSSTVVMHYDDGELNGNTEGTLALWKTDDNGATWTKVGGIDNASGNTITKTGSVSSFSRWTAADASHPLGVANFSASPNSINFGTVGTGVNKVDSVTVSNSGTATLNLTSIVSDSASFTVFPQNAGVPPGGSIKVFITFNPSTAGAKSGHVTINYDVAGSPFVVNVSGTGFLGTPAISFSKTNIAFGDVRIGDSKMDSVDVTNTGDGVLHITHLLVTLPPNGFPPYIGPIDPGQSKRYYFTYQPTVGGFESAPISFTHDGSNRDSVVTWSGRGVESHFLPAQPTLVFGDIKVGETKADSILIINTGTASLNVSFVTSDNAKFIVGTSSGVVAAGGSKRFSVTFAPDVEASETGNLIFVHDADTTPDTVNLAGNGVLPHISVSTNTLAFGNVRVGTNKTDTVVVTNTGTGTLTVTSDTSDNGHFSIFPTSGSLAPSASQDFFVTYSAFDAGSASGTVTIRSDAGNENVSVSGTGVEPVFSAPSPLSFGNVALGSSKMDSIVVTNTGGYDLVISQVSSGDAETFSVTPLNGTIPASGTKSFYVTYTPAGAGFASTSITFTHDAAGSPSAVTVNGSGIEPVFSATPTSLTFGDVETGSSKQDSIYVINNGGAPLVISSVVSLDGNYSVTPSSDTLGASEFAYFYVTFTPSSVGAKSSGITFTHNGSHTFDTVAVDGVGKLPPAPAFSSSDASVSFGEVKLGSTSNDSVVITNTGTATLNISSVTSSNSQFSVTPATGTIAASASSTFYLTFTPTTFGTVNGKISFVSNATTSPDSVMVSGEATDTTKFRTFNLGNGATDFASKAGTLALKSVKGSKTAKYLAVSGTLNLRMAAEYVFVKSVTAVKGTVLTFGIDLGKTDPAKTHGWLSYKNTTGIGKFVGVAQTGAPYPIDSATHNNAISAKGKRSGKAYTKAITPTNKMSNMLWAEGTIFKFNLMASQIGVTPSNFGSITLDTAYTLFGKNLQGATLTQFATYVDSLMTFWSEHNVYDTTGSNGNFLTTQAKMLAADSGLTTILSRINNGFYSAIGTVDSNNRGTHDYMDSAAVAAKMKYALVLRGVKTATEGCSFLNHTPGKIAELMNFASVGSSYIPDKVALGQNYPNPFNPTTTINVGIPDDMDGAIATLKVYNVLGQEVATVINHEAMSAGDNAVTFDAAKLSSGVYFYRLSLNGGEVTAIKKMMLLK